MKIAIIHLSDFHVSDKDHFLDIKINGVLSAINILHNIDDFIVVFSGDLSNSGQVNEFKKSRFLIGRLINGIKLKNNNKFVNLFMVPGNHDLCLPKNARERKDIQAYYDNEKIDELILTEKSYLDNYYSYSNDKNTDDILLNKEYCTFDGYKIQFNLINSAPFSTLKPDDKELHYFPDSRITKLKRSADANLCITVMHHSYEWFNWNYKADLEKAIIDNSEFLLYGHDHREQTTNLSIDNSLDTWISSAGAMKFTSANEDDSFNAMVIDTETNVFDGFVFNWDKDEKIYLHKQLATKKSLQNHSAKLMPLPSYIKTIKEDTYNFSEDFSNYFVFPKLVSENQSEYSDKKTVKNMDVFKEVLYEKKYLVVSGPTNSGKTTLLKYVYCSIMSEMNPLFVSANNMQRIRTNNFIRHLFEEQYGDERALFEKYQQLDSNKKILIVDGWDLLKIKKNQKEIMQKIMESFGYIIISVTNSTADLVETIKGDLSDESQFFDLNIKPFFKEKRNELVRNICMQKNGYEQEEINNVNKIIDSLVQNNSSLFSLNPAFIVMYTKFFLQNPYQDYSRGEAVFSKVFENELNHSIIKFVKSRDVDEIFTVFEEIAGYMYKNKKDELPIEEVRSVIDIYNSDYGEKISLKEIVEIGLKSRVIKQTDELSIYFLNKNYLSYFIAKYLIRVSLGEPADETGIEYALKNICFGINADIVMFISYLLDNTRIISQIRTYAGQLLEPLDALDLSKKNISLLHNMQLDQINPPTEKEKKAYVNEREEIEECSYSEEVIEARGLFDYDDNEIDSYKNRIACAIKYTEIICKALPTFHSRLRLQQKKNLIDYIFLYPRKIVYAIIRPFDINKKEICESIVDFAEQNNISKRNGRKYTNEDILIMLNDNVRAIMLSMFDHFSELATSSKSFELLMGKSVNDISEQLERLLMIESIGNTDLLIKDAEKLLKKYQGTEYSIMILLIMRKHVLTNDLPFNKRRQISDKFFGGRKMKYLKK